MKLINKTTIALLAGTVSLMLLPSVAAAQAMSPMRAKVDSFTDSFAVRVYPANPYEHRIRVEVNVYDQDFRPVKEARVTPASFTLGARFARPVTVMVPFAGHKNRKVRICTEAIPFPGETTTIKAQVCGKFLGQRLQ